MEFLLTALGWLVTAIAAYFGVIVIIMLVVLAIIFFATVFGGVAVTSKRK